jgi:hypothetical protein
MDKYIAGIAENNKSTFVVGWGEETQLLVEERRHDYEEFIYSIMSLYTYYNDIRVCALNMVNREFKTKNAQIELRKTRLYIGVNGKLFVIVGTDPASHTWKYYIIYNMCDIRINNHDLFSKKHYTKECIKTHIEYTWRKLGYKLRYIAHIQIIGDIQQYIRDIYCELA